MNHPHAFASPEDVEQAFYDAIERGDLDALMAIWSEEDDIVCVHPTGQRLAGHAAIRESWRAILAENRLRVASTIAARWPSMLLSVHHVIETLYVGQDQLPHGPLHATNIYARGPHGWRLICRHSSAAGEVPADIEVRILH
jgi:hypothetical protein